MTKKKTVKELHEDFKVLEDKVGKLERFKEVFDKLSMVDIGELEKKVKIIDDATSDPKIQHLEKKVNENFVSLKKLLSKKEENKENKFPCKKCSSIFTDKATMKTHTREKHETRIKCKLCEETFDQTFKLELHLKTHEMETFKCERCDKTFHLKWRLEKHKKGHEMVNVKFCHYFNNEKPCPYEEIGCMYMHTKSEACRFQKFCKNKLCQFQHSDKETRNSTNFENDQVEDANSDISVTENKEINENLDVSSQLTKLGRISCKICFKWLKDENDVNNHMINQHKTNATVEGQNVFDLESDDEEEEEEDLECDDCGKVLDDFDSYIEHRGIGDCVVYCDKCDKTFKEEVDLKKHKEKHCSICGKEFSSVNVLKLHQKNCK